MEIKYDKTGRILSCSTLENVERGKLVIKIAEEDLPKDFLATFALGKYRVKEGKVIKNQDFVLPESPEIDFLNILREIVQKDKSNKETKRTK